MSEKKPRQRKERPYIRSTKRISMDDHKPKFRIVVVTELGLRKMTCSMTRADDIEWVAETFRKKFMPKIA
jgi:hypothetical protein